MANSYSQCLPAPGAGPGTITESFENLSYSSNFQHWFGGWGTPTTPYTFPSGLKLLKPNPNPAGTVIIGDWSKGEVYWGLCQTSTDPTTTPHGTAYMGINNNNYTPLFELPAPSQSVGAYVESCAGAITLTAYNAIGSIVGSCTVTGTGFVSNWGNNFVGVQSTTSNIVRFTISGNYTIIDKISFQGGCTSTTWYRDMDGDGFASGTVSDCNNPGAGYTSTVLPVNDCDDATVNYSDDDADGFGSDTKVPCGGVTNSDDCDDATVMYGDVDGDGFGGDTKVACNGVTNTADCDDNRVTYADNDGDGFGSDTKVACGGVSNSDDCDDAVVSYSDVDGDGFGSDTQVACGGVTNSSDCDDATVNYADIDNDGFGSDTKVPCGGVTNSDDCDDAVINYSDSDGDGFGSDTKVACGGVTNSDDCDDATVRYNDADGDGFGSTSKVACGGVTNSSDCDDTKWTWADNDNDGYGAGTNTACGVANNYNSNDSDGKPMIYICHKGNTLVVNANAWSAHAAHGDTRGKCGFSARSANQGAKPPVEAETSLFTMSNYPNPATRTTTIQYTLPATAEVSIVLMDISGKVVGELFNGQRSAGTYSFSYNTAKLSAGVYYCRMVATTDEKENVSSFKLVKQ
jgi:hypothetical protein